MGMFWDLIQHGEIHSTKQRTRSLEERVEQLEEDVRTTNKTVIRLLQLLEEHFGKDLDGDGRIG